MQCLYNYNQLITPRLLAWLLQPSDCNLAYLASLLTNWQYALGFSIFGSAVRYIAYLVVNSAPLLGAWLASAQFWLTYLVRYVLPWFSWLAVWIYIRTRKR